MALAAQRAWRGSGYMGIDEPCSRCGQDGDQCRCAESPAPARQLTAHPIAALFPDLSPADFEAFKQDIQKHGVKVPILLHGGVILDGRQRYRACRELGLPCPSVEWNGLDPWLEVQSRNLLRRQLTAEQVCAIRLLAARRFPELAASFEAARAEARARKAQARGQPRGMKALSRSQDRFRESADAIGALIGVSGSTVKRIERLARAAPQLLPRVASGELSVRRALRDTVTTHRPAPGDARDEPTDPAVRRAGSRISRVVRDEWERCPADRRESLLRWLQVEIRHLVRQHAAPKAGRAKSGGGAAGRPTTRRRTWRRGT